MWPRAAGASFPVAHAQKPDGGGTPQLGWRPKPFSRKCLARCVVNQTDQIQLVGHRCELSPNGLHSDKESAVFHDRNLETETNRRTMNFQGTAHSVLTVCLTSGGRFTLMR